MWSFPTFGSFTGIQASRNSEETQRVKAMLRENNYSSGFIKECEKALKTKPTKPTTNGFVLLCHIIQVSDKKTTLLSATSLMYYFLFLRIIEDSFRFRFRSEEDRNQWGLRLKSSGILFLIWKTRGKWLAEFICSSTYYSNYTANYITTMVDKIPWDTCVIALIFCVLKTEF